MARVRYFAAAEEAAGLEEESRPETTIGALRAALAAERPELGAILPTCSSTCCRPSRGDEPVGPPTIPPVLR